MIGYTLTGTLHGPLADWPCRDGIPNFCSGLSAYSMPSDAVSLVSGCNAKGSFVSNGMFSALRPPAIHGLRTIVGILASDAGGRRQYRRPLGHIDSMTTVPRPYP